MIGQKYIFITLVTLVFIAGVILLLCFLLLIYSYLNTGKLKMPDIRRLFSRRPKPYLFDGKYEIIPAFTWKGETYFMHKDPLNTCAGRGLTALVFMEEMLMRCDVQYLKDHIEATKKVLSGGKINVVDLVKLNLYLEERVNLLAAIPEHVYKLASVTFFTETESPVIYDMAKGREKIEMWKAEPDMYAFFLQTPLRDLIPSLVLPENNSKQFLEVAAKIDQIHLQFLRETLSGKTSTTGTKK